MSSDPRFLLQKVTTLSIPLVVINLATLDTLETIGKLPRGAPATMLLRKWLRDDLESGWRKLEKMMGKTQQSLDLGSAPDELPLGRQDGSA